MTTVTATVYVAEFRHPSRGPAWRRLAADFPTQGEAWAALLDARHLAGCDMRVTSVERLKPVPQERT
ncbi:MAG TPA: hypothetical protein VGF55_10345 [Gemmataceae bacterium]|jgi:hypothetical protein